MPERIIDTHLHLWDLKKIPLDWTKDAGALNRSFVLDDYRRAAEGLNIVKAVYMEVDTPAGRKADELEYVAGLIRDRQAPLVAAVVYGDPADPGLPAWVEKLKANPAVKGVRRVMHVPSTPKGTLVTPAVVKGVKLLAEKGLSFDCVVKPEYIPDVAALADAVPGARLILDHIGNPLLAADRKTWEKDIADLAGRKNVICKISGVFAHVKPGEWKADDLAGPIRHAIAAFGWDRVIWASDWPVLTLGGTLRQWVETAAHAVRDASPAQRAKLFHDNAAAFYGV
jgi:L-fuconolactonase